MKIITNLEMKAYHTFAICAYKESKYLDKCIKSLINQKVKSNIIICTSTPNKYIENISKKYNLTLFIREGISNIKDDWNFAYNCADTPLVTVAHQDDVYSHSYLVELSRYVNLEDMSIFITDYIPLKHNKIGKRDINSIIRRILRIPMKFKVLSSNKFFKKGILAFGNSICCPFVTYNKKRLGDDLFTSELGFNIDWDTFYMLAQKKGRFVYIDKPLGAYRIHSEATSMEFIENNLRITEDRIMFNKFWPEKITNIIMMFYKKAYDTYK